MAYPTPPHRPPHHQHQQQGGHPGYGGYAAPQGPPPDLGPRPDSYTTYGNGPPPDARGYAPQAMVQPPPQQYHQGSGGYMPNFDQSQQYAAPYGPPPSQYGRPAAMDHPYADIGPVHAQPHGPQQGEMFYQYSNCTGKRKALCIGINYVGSRNELKGCHNDARNMQRFICSNYGFQEDDIVILLDSPSSNPMQVPTRMNMINAMRWLVADAQPNDSLFFHYSGHGGQVRDQDGDEEDGMDDVIYPVDFEQTGPIVDDEMHDILVKPLPPGCRLTALYDSCHSGTALDLPYIYSTEGKIKEPNLLKEGGQSAFTAVTDYMRGDLAGAVGSVFQFGKKAISGNKAYQQTVATKTSPADVISLSGCKDSQTSADTSEAGQATGAMSFALISVLTKYRNLTYIQLLNAVRDELRGRYSQKPQLSASHPMDTNLLFII